MLVAAATGALRSYLKGRGVHVNHTTVRAMVPVDALKHSPEAIATRVLFDILGRVPKVLEDFSNEPSGRKASLVMTNVAGPRARPGGCQSSACSPGRRIRTNSSG